MRSATRYSVHVLQLLRWQFWFVAVVPVIVGYQLGAANLRLWQIVLLIVIFGPCIEGASEAINDFYDRSSDNLKHIHHIHGVQLSGGTGLIQRNVFRAETVRNIALALYGVAVALSLCFHSSTFTALVIVGVVCGFVYSAPPCRLKERGILGPAIIGFSFGTVTLCTGYAASGNSISWHMLIMSLPLAVIIMGHFLTHQIADFEVDSAAGIRTLGVLLGPRVTAVVATGMMLAGMVIMLVLLPQSTLNRMFACVIVSATALVVWQTMLGSMVARTRLIAVLVQGLASLVYLR